MRNRVFTTLLTLSALGCTVQSAPPHAAKSAAGTSAMARDADGNDVPAGDISKARVAKQLKTKSSRAKKALIKTKGPNASPSVSRPRQWGLEAESGGETKNDEGASAPPAPSAAPKVGGDEVNRVAPSGSFSEEAHEMNAELTRRLSAADGAVGVFEASKSLDSWRSGDAALRNCLTFGRGFREKFSGYPELDQQLSELENRIEEFANEKP